MSPRILSIGALVIACPLAAEPTLMNVRIQDYAGLSKGHWKVAKAAAQTALHGAGLRIQWLHCSPGKGKPDEECSGSTGPNTRMVRILPSAQAAGIRPGSKELGRAVLDASGAHGTFAYIFHQQVIDLAARELSVPRLSSVAGRLTGPLLEARLLGYAIAHELGHLAGYPHATAGLMHPQWTTVELADILAGTLRFSPGQQVPGSERFSRAGRNCHTTGCGAKDCCNP